MKRAFALALSAVLAVSVLASCSGQTQPASTPAPATQAPATTAPTVAPATQAPATQAAATQAPATQAPSAPQADAYGITPNGTWPIVTSPKTMKFFTATAEPIDTFEFTSFYENLSGVHIEWEIISANGAEKIPLKLASNDLPDVFFGCGLTDAQIVSYAMSGVFKPLNDSIAKYGPHIQWFIDEYDIVKRYSYTPDGNIYSLLRIEDDYVQSQVKKSWVYQPWLDKLNIAMPQTIDQFYDMLVAFNTKEPAGPGIEVVPFTGADTEANGEIDSWLFNSFFYYDRATYLEVVGDGKIQFNGLSDGYKEALKFANKLYKEGLLAPETFTQKRTDIQAQTSGGAVNTIGVVTGYSTGHFALNTAEKPRQTEFRQVPALEGPKGVRNAFDRGVLINNGRYLVTKNCESVDLAIRWADLFYDEYGQMDLGFHAYMGKKDVRWQEAKPGELSVEGNQAKWKRLNLPSGTKNTMDWGQLQPYGQSAGFWDCFANADPAAGIPQSIPSALLSRTAYDPYSALDKYVPFMYFPLEDLDEITSLKKDVTDVLNNYRVRFITGALDIDKDWDTYTKELNGVNWQKYLKFYQDAYTASLKTLGSAK